MGKKEADYYRLVAFRDLLNDCALMDIGSKGCAYTWSNNREGGELVKKRLDRTLYNMEWRVSSRTWKPLRYRLLDLTIILFYYHSSRTNRNEHDYFDLRPIGGRMKSMMR